MDTDTGRISEGRLTKRARETGEGGRRKTKLRWRDSVKRDL